MVEATADLDIDCVKTLRAIRPSASIAALHPQEHALNTPLGGESLPRHACDQY